MKKLYIIYTFIFIALAGCNDKYLDNYPVPEASTVAEFSVALSNEGFVPAEATFTNESVIPDVAGEHEYLWSFGDGTLSTEESPSHTYTEPGRYEVRLVITVDEDIAFRTKTVTVLNPTVVGRRLYFGDRNAAAVQLAIINEDEPINTPLPGDEIARPYGLAVDTINQHLYIAGFNSGDIYRTDLEGKNRIVFRSGLAGPTGLAIDLNTNNLFWATDDGIQKADLASEDVNQYETIITDITDDPDGLCLDRENERIYFVTFDGGLYRMNYDGSGNTEIITDVLGTGCLIVGDQLFFHSYDLDTENHTLKVADLDGNVQSTIASGMDGDVYGIAYNPEDNKIYWNDQRRGEIVRANLDGTDSEVFLQDPTAQIYAIAIGDKIE